MYIYDHTVCIQYKIMNNIMYQTIFILADLTYSKLFAGETRKGSFYYLQDNLS